MSDEELANLFKSTNNIAYRDQLIENNMGLVYMVANQFTGKTLIERDDLIQLGSLGLIKAANYYDASRGTKFSTCATRYIQNEIKKYRDTMLRKMRNPSNSVSFESSVVNYKDGKSMTLGDTLSTNISAEDEVIAKHELCNLYDNLMKLKEKERFVIRGYYGIQCEQLSQRQIAKILDRSYTVPYRIVKSSLTKLRENMNQG